MSASRSAKPTFRAATAKDLASIEMWLRDERERTGAGFYCNWNIITDGFETEEMFVVDVDGDPVGFLVNEGAHHIIAEVRPDDEQGHDAGRDLPPAWLRRHWWCGPISARPRADLALAGIVREPG